MLKKTITYTDYNGDERTESFYFNLTEAELTKMELSKNGGMEQYIRRIVETKDGQQIMDTFEKILLASYGEKSLDGRRFIKSKELAEAFTQTEAYSELFMELVTDAKAGAEFVNGLMPKKIADKVAEANKTENTVSIHQ